MNDVNRRMLDELPDQEDYRFHPLLSAEELIQREDIDLTHLLRRAGSVLEGFQEPIDGIIGFWDFPVSSMIPILCARFGLHGPALEPVVKCEHKYWSRLEQRAAITEFPAFGLVDLEDPRPPEGVPFPMWLKPVKSTSSELAFEVHNRAEFRDAAGQIRDGVNRLGTPFDLVLAHLDVPGVVARAGGTACLAEASMRGRQVTAEGYSLDGEVVVYGVVDSVNYPDSPSFLRYQYPSSLPNHVSDRIAQVSRRIIRHIGLDHVTFNIEFFYEPDSEDLRILEINPRHSQSHAPLFDLVDGAANHHYMVRIATGGHPDMPHRRGPFDVAAKWFARRFQDGVVRLAPTEDDAQRVERDMPGTMVDVCAHPGDRLSELPLQDSYSYELMRIFLGASDERSLVAKYERCLAALPFRVEES